MRRSRGRPERVSAGTPRTEVDELLSLLGVQNVIPIRRRRSTEVVDSLKPATPNRHAISRWLQSYVDARLEEELETIATAMHTMDFDDLVIDVNVLAPLMRDRHAEGINEVVRRCRRRMAKLVRDHRRRDEDNMLEYCIPE